ncbi:MAG: OmpA family protein [Flavobacteriales bacterium]|nr:OmpA family protein [Flavobacteriales bacterium]
MKAALLFLFCCVGGSIWGQSKDSLYFELADSIFKRDQIHRLDFEKPIWQYDKAILTLEASQNLKEVAEFLKREIELLIEIAVYPYCGKSSNLSTNLEKARAKELKSFLVEHGVEEWRIRSRGYSDSTSKKVGSMDTLLCPWLEVGSVVSCEQLVNYDSPEEKYAFQRLFNRTELKIRWVMPEVEVVPIDTAKLRSGQFVVIPDIRFELAKAQLQACADTQLRLIANYLMDYPTYVIEVGYHRDCRGSEASSRNLSQNRAEAIVNRLVEMGVARERLIPKGYGESKLNVLVKVDSVSGDTITQVLSCEYINTFKEKDLKKFERYHQMNRRAELLLVGRDYYPKD